MIVNHDDDDMLDTTFSRLVFFVTVTCPCSSTTKCHVNLFVYNNNNNNNNSIACCVREMNKNYNHAMIAMISSNFTISCFQILTLPDCCFL